MAFTLALRVLIFTIIISHFSELLTLSVSNATNQVLSIKENNINRRNNKLGTLNDVQFLLANSTSEPTEKIFSRVKTSLFSIPAGINSSFAVLAPHSSFDNTYPENTFSSHNSVNHFQQQFTTASTNTMAPFSNNDYLNNLKVVPESPAVRKHKHKTKTRHRRPRPTVAPNSSKQKFDVHPVTTNLSITETPDTADILAHSVTVPTNIISMATPTTATLFSTTTFAGQSETNLFESESNHSPVVNKLKGNTAKKDNLDLGSTSFSSSSLSGTSVSSDQEVIFLSRLSLQLMDALEKVMLSNEALFKLSKTALINIRSVNGTQFACINHFCNLV